MRCLIDWARVWMCENILILIEKLAPADTLRGRALLMACKGYWQAIRFF